MTQPLPPPSKRQRRRSSGVPLYSHGLNLAFPVQQEAEEDNASAATQAQANGQHGCLSSLEISTTATSGSDQEALQRQLDALDALYRVYKVEHYAALEEMLHAHQQLTAQGKSAIMSQVPTSQSILDGSREQADATASGQPPLNSTSNAHTHRTIRRMVHGTRAGADMGTSTTLADDVLVTATTTAQPTPASPPTAPPMPSSPPMQQMSTHAKSDLSGSPPGVSLNIWMAPPAASSNTPQSLRHHGQPLHATGTLAEQHNSLGVSRMGPAAAASVPAAAVGAPTSASAPAAPSAGAGRAGGVVEGSGNHVDAHDGTIPEMGLGQDGNSAQRLTGAGLPGPRGSSYGDDVLGYGSDAEPASYTDVEEEVLTATGQQDAVGAQRLAQWRARWAANHRQVLELEALASCSTQSYLDANGALASLSGRAGRFLVCRTTVLIGRGSDTKGGVDVDLGREAAAAGPSSAVQEDRLGSCAVRVSRRQAFLSLRPDGSWWLENVGRRKLHVDGSAVAQFSGVVLPHLAMLEVGGLQLLFMVNQAAVDRVLRRTARVVA